MMGIVGLEHYLSVAAILFGLGCFTCLSRTNAIAILMGVELILNAANINFVAFAHYHGNQIDGHVMTIFVIVLAAANAAVALAIVLGLYRRFRTIDAEKAVTLRK